MENGIISYMRNVILLLCFYFIEFMLELSYNFSCSNELCYSKYFIYKLY